MSQIVGRLIVGRSSLSTSSFTI